MSSSENLAIAAHLHVLLRRKTGRVTDTEWLASNRDYAREIIRFTREKAAEDGHAELGAWADKLEAVMAQPDPRPSLSLFQQASDALRARHLPAPLTPPPSEMSAGGDRALEGGTPPAGQPPDPHGPRYVKGLR
jgi:hypothetical protein